MNDFETLSVSLGFNLGNVVGELIDDVKLGTWIGFTLGNVFGVISGVGKGVEFTLSDDPEVKFVWGDDGGNVSDGGDGGCFGGSIALLKVWEI